MIDCEDVIELLDAYALGASEHADARAIENHVADCVRCWDALSTAQRTAALVALSVPMKAAPPGLEARIMQEAARERRAARVERGQGGGRLRFGWPATTGALGLAAAAALAFASLLQIQMNDLRNDKDNLAQQLETTQEMVQDQAKVITISAASDSQNMVMEAVAAPEGAWGEYHWSRSADAGFIVCHDLPAPPEGEVYQAWFELDGKQVSAGTFSPEADGGCVYPMRPDGPVRGANGVGVSQEKAGGSESPSGDWLIWAAFEKN